MRVRLGACVLDTDLRQLTRAAIVIPLSPKAFRLLEVLAERQPRAVSQADLRALVWPELQAGGTTLARLVNEIRSAIGDEERPPRFLRTVPRFGYALSGAQVEPSGPAAAANGFALEWDNRRIPLGVGEHVIGRAANALISVASEKVSRRHAILIVTENRAVLQDLGSKNGTYVGAARIDQPAELKDGDRIVIGPVVLIFRAGGEGDATASASRV